MTRRPMKERVIDENLRSPSASASGRIHVLEHDMSPGSFQFLSSLEGFGPGEGEDEFSDELDEDDEEFAEDEFEDADDEFAGAGDGELENDEFESDEDLEDDDEDDDFEDEDGFDADSTAEEEDDDDLEGEPGETPDFAGGEIGGDHH